MTPARRREIFEALAREFTGQADAYERLSREVQDGWVSLALAELGNLVSIIGVALSDCADRGHPDPITRLSAYAVGWVSDNSVLRVVPNSGGELARLVDDGCPHDAA